MPRGSRLLLLVVVVLAGAGGCDLGPSAPVQVSDVVGTWCGEDRGTLNIRTDGTFTGDDLSVTFVRGYADSGYTKAVFHPPISTRGTWRLHTLSGTQRVALTFESFTGVEPSSGAGGELVPKGNPMTLVDYLDDPDTGDAYLFTRCPGARSSGTSEHHLGQVPIGWSG